MIVDLTCLGSIFSLCVSPRVSLQYPHRPSRSLSHMVQSTALSTRPVSDGGAGSRAHTRLASYQSGPADVDCIIV